MAYFRKLPSGRWRAEVEVSGTRETQGGFATKREAQEWAAKTESDMRAGKLGKWPLKTVRDAVDRYLKEVTPTKGSKVNEEARLSALRRDFPDLMAKRLIDVTPDDLSAWVAERLKTVKPATVSRESNTISNIWTVAAKVWRWCPLESPWTFVTIPAVSPPRDRRVSWREVRTICRWLGYVSGRPPVTKQQEVAHAWLIALRTAMRAGEVLGLTAADADLETRVVRLQKHKTLRYTGRPRFVPIRKQAARLLSVLIAGAEAAKREDLFTVNGDSAGSLFYKATRQLGITNMRFHDSRGEALTLLSRRVDVKTLQKISGHVDINTLIDHYYRETPEDIAKRI